MSQKYIIGVDEVGRGPVAGPVTICVFIMNKDYNPLKYFKNNILKDSKKLSDESRRKIRTVLNKDKLKGEIDFVIISKSAEYIEKNGIAKTIKICIEDGLKRLIKLNYNLDKKYTEIMLDGAMRIDDAFVEKIMDKYKMNLKYSINIKGDENIPAIALASILAKVCRDNYMIYLEKKIYDEEGRFYNFKNNVGYGTAEHYEYIKKYGVTKYHRKSWIKE
ncbi:MAG: ribonuclease HII [Cyanobium sp. MAG06]|nr:ribonuclease HII [Cyanobium sp. MAG06]